MANNIDQILEAGIASYGQQEPLAGLPGRIQSRIALADTAPARKAWPLATAASSAAIIVLAVFLWPRPHPTENRQPAVSIAFTQRITKPEATASSAPPVRHQRKHRAQALPKLPVFPAPTPLSAEERRLVALVEKDPEGAAAAFESFRKQSEPLQIEKLTIQPLDSGGRQ